MEPLKIFVLYGDDFEEVTQLAIRDIVEAVIGEVPATFTEEVLKRISAATFVASFADHVIFTETLQQHKEDSWPIWPNVTRHCLPMNQAARARA